MLFRPYKAVYIGRFHVPFTPGIIPGQRKRIAASIGRVVSNELLNPEIMEQAMLSDETVAGLKDAFRSKLVSYKDEARTIQEAVTEFYPEDKLKGKIDHYRWKNESFVSRLFQGACGVQPGGTGKSEFRHNEERVECHSLSWGIAWFYHRIGECGNNEFGADYLNI